MRALLASPVLPSIALCYVHAKFQLELEDHEIFMKNDVVIVEQLEQEQLRESPIQTACKSNHVYGRDGTVSQVPFREWSEWTITVRNALG